MSPLDEAVNLCATLRAQAIERETMAMAGQYGITDGVNEWHTIR
jgi:hypothetical protein